MGSTRVQYASLTSAASLNVQDRCRELSDNSHGDILVRYHCRAGESGLGGGSGPQPCNDVVGLRQQTRLAARGHVQNATTNLVSRNIGQRQRGNCGRCAPQTWRIFSRISLAFPPLPGAMDFLKSAVASAMSKGPAFGYTFGDRVDVDDSIWTLHNGTKRVRLKLPFVPDATS